MSLPAVLASLDRSLPTRKPRATKPPAITTHADLRALWTWGRATDAIGHEVLATVAEDSGDWWFSQVWLTPAQAKAAQKELQKVAGFPSTLVPFATDEAGNYTCHDATSGKLVDWDHETRKRRTLPGSLTTIFTRVGKQLVAEQKRSAAAATARAAKAAKAGTAKAPASGAMPVKIRLEKSAIVRKLTAQYKANGFEDAVLAADGTSFGGLVARRRTACFGDLARDVELVPAEPGLVAQRKADGYLMCDSSGLAVDGDLLAWRDSTTGHVTLWAWRTGAPALVAGGAWTKGAPYFHQNVLRLRGGWLACTAEVARKGTLALWPVDAFPKLAAAKAVKELAPRTRIVLGSNSALFDLHADGTAVTLVGEALVRWDARTGKQLARTVLKGFTGSDIAASPVDGRTLALATTGELLVLDAKLAVVHRMKTMTGWRHGSTVRFAPSGAWFATSAYGWDKAPSEVVVWNSTTYKEIARIAIKNGVNGFGVRGVSASALMTVSPLALLTLS